MKINVIKVKFQVRQQMLIIKLIICIQQNHFILKIMIIIFKLLIIFREIALHHKIIAQDLIRLFKNI